MAQIRERNFCCAVCLDLLKEPATIPCGHSYCRTCISRYWDGKACQGVYDCPQCRLRFSKRPVLMKNTMLAELVDQLKEVQVQEDAGGPSFAAAEDVACDVCVGRKRKASKSCLKCVASYCEEHLQSHHQSAAFKSHRLVDPSKKLQENICSRHDEVMKMFCRTDQQCICLRCSVEEHKGHNMVFAAAEHTEKQRELEERRVDIHKNIQDREKELQLLEEQLKSIQLSADHTVQYSQRIITELIRVLLRRSSELEEEARSKHQTEVSAVRALQEKLKQEIRELKKRDAELQQISTTEDHIQFVLSYSSLSALSVSTHSSITHTHPHSFFQELTEHLHTILMEDWTKVWETVERVKVLQRPEPTSRAGFLEHSQEVTLDPNTVYRYLKLSEGNRNVTRVRDNHPHPHHQEGFQCLPVLSTESLTGHCYWEVEVEERGGVIGIGVAYSSISLKREWAESVFGSHDNSWILYCQNNTYTFIQNKIHTKISGPGSSRVGVFVDHTAGTLSFYSIGDTMTLLHRVNTTFTEPLHAGVCIYNIFKAGTSANLRQGYPTILFRSPSIHQPTQWKRMVASSESGSVRGFFRRWSFFSPL